MDLLVEDAEGVAHLSVIAERLGVIARVDDDGVVAERALLHAREDRRDVRVLLVNAVQVVVVKMRVVVGRFARRPRLERHGAVLVDEIRVVHVRELHDRHERLASQLSDVLAHVVREKVLRRAHVEVGGGVQIRRGHHLRHTQVLHPQARVAEHHVLRRPERRVVAGGLRVVEHERPGVKHIAGLVRTHAGPENGKGNGRRRVERAHFEKRESIRDERIRVGRPTTIAFGFDADGVRANALQNDEQDVRPACGGRRAPFEYDRQ